MSADRIGAIIGALILIGGLLSTWTSLSTRLEGIEVRQKQGWEEALRMIEDIESDQRWMRDRLVDQICKER